MNCICHSRSYWSRKTQAAGKTQYTCTNRCFSGFLPLYTWPLCTWHVLTTDRTVSAVRVIKRSHRLKSQGGSYNHDGVPKITWKWEPRDTDIYGVCIFAWHWSCDFRYNFTRPTIKSQPRVSQLQQVVQVSNYRPTGIVQVPPDCRGGMQYLVYQKWRPRIVSRWRYRR